MAHVMTKQGSLDNQVTYEFICDSIADMNDIPNKYRTMGSTAIVLSGESESMDIYIANSMKEWKQITISASEDIPSATGVSF